MDDWTHGYDVTVGYTFGFGREMAPGWLDFCAARAGRPPARTEGAAPLRYLELGAGQGMGLCLLAAANPDIEFLGVDFHPDHVAHAEGVARAAGLANARFVRADFVDLAAAWPADFGTFDYVAMHGIHSWIAPAVRAALVTCLGHATHPGSIVYNAYNAQPGWLATIPFQHVARRIKEASGKPGDAVLGDTVALFDRLRAGGAATFRFLPGLAPRIDSVRRRNANYLIQEYLHESWHPFWHSEVAREMERAGLAWLGTATLAETLLPAALPRPLRETIAAAPDAALRQDLQDFVINQAFRRDLFHRAGGEGGGADAGARIAATPLHLLAPPDGRPLKVETAFAEVTLDPPAFAGIVAALRSGPLTVAELAALPGLREQGMANALQLLVLLVEARVLAIGLPRRNDAAAAQRINAGIARAAAAGLPHDHLAAAALGSAVPASAVELLLLDAWFERGGGGDAATLAAGAAARLDARGDAHAREARGQLDQLAGAFLDALPRWRALGMLA